MKRIFSAKRVTAASVLMAALTSGQALADDKTFVVRMSVDGEMKVPAWLTINYIYGEWTNVGEHHSCQEWVAPPETVDWGSSFQQSRLCKQTQNRLETPVLFNPVLKTTKEGVAIYGSRDVSTTEFRSNIGTRDYIDGERANSYGAWTRNSPNYDCGEWSPKPSDINLLESFTQSRTCSKDEIRVRDVFHVWASGKETFKRKDSEEQTVSEIEQQGSTGTKDYINAVRVDNWTPWAVEGEPYGCQSWSPAPSTINLNQNFQQSRSCSQKEISDRDIFDVWRSGKETLNDNEPRSRVVVVSQVQDNVGTKDFIKSTRNDEWTAWTDSAAPYGCSDWTPEKNTVKLDEKFTQTRSCSQRQVRERDILNVWESGKETLNKVENASTVITVDQSQASVGTLDFIVSQTTPAWSSWGNDGIPYNCATWSPSVDTVNLNQSFTQSRECSQNQDRSRTIENVWKSGKKTFNREETDDQTITVTQNKSATGTKNYKTGTLSYGSWSAWSNDGGFYECGTWSPSANTVNLGISFTQNRSCEQDQKRSRIVYDVWADGTKSEKTTQAVSQTISVGQSQVATGTKDFVTGTSAGAWGSWSNLGTPTSCQAWSPSTGTVNLGTSFTQSRSCVQDQVRTRTIYNVWKSGKKTAKTTETGNQSITVTQSQSATGTKDFVTGTSAGAWGSWSNVGTPTSCQAWSPSVGTVNLGTSFTQSRYCIQDQSRTRTIYNVWKSGKKTAKTTETGNQSINVLQNQSATGTKNYVTGTSYGSWTGWSNSGGVYSCSGYSPATSTVNLGSTFTQSRSCSQNQTRSRTVYNVWKNGAKTYKSTDGDSQTITVSQSQSATGTKDFVTGTSEGAWGSWSNVGAPRSCQAWSPSTGTVNLGTSFTQSRYCIQDQSRTRTIYNVWKSGKKTAKTTETGNQSINVLQNQSATGTKNYVTGTSYGAWSGWSNSGGVYSCSGYSPATSTVNLGSTFTQSRSCSQNQTRSRTVYNVWKNGAKTYKSTDGDSQTITVSQSQSATGTKDFVTGTSAGSWSGWSNSGGVYSCSGYLPETSTVDYGQSFTQTRTCSQKRVRSRTIYNVWKSGKTTIKSTESDSTVIDVTQSRSATGTRNVVVGSQSTTGAWFYTGNASCGAYSPSASTVNYGTKFTQTRSCSRPRARDITVYNVYTDGTKTVKSTTRETGTYNYTTSITSTGTKDYITSSAWNNSYSYTYSAWTCGSYSPSAITVPDGVKFTQSRTCTRTKYQNKRYYNTWYLAGRLYTGSTSVYSTTSESKNETRDAWGADPYCGGRDPRTGIWTICK